MRSERILKYTNIAIAVALALLLGVVYWYAWRPLPRTSGVVHLPVDRKITIVRDALGTPHISAQTLEDAVFAQGFATAQERMWQMEGLRRLAGGELAEIAGKPAIESDLEYRRLRLRRLADAAEPQLDPLERRIFAAYARGVNAWLDTHRGRLPLEFAVIGLEPRPWRIADSLLVGFYMFRTLTTSWKDELTKRDLLAGGDAVKINLLFSTRTGAEVHPGSNAWAVSGRRTASGRAMLANDMHLQWSIPGIWFAIHLEAPKEGLRVAGVSLPGAPGVIVGHNERIAWGITNLQFDVQDLYREQINETTGQYRYRGQVEQARPEREVVLVRGAPPVELIVWVTRHGPIVTSIPAAAQGVHEHFALRWVAAEPGPFHYPVLSINLARIWSEFLRALESWDGPGSNFVYADADGNIGYHAAGKLPIRKGWNGDLPVDGASGDFEWQGYIPFDQLPWTFNPPSGLIVTANQNPFPDDFPAPVNGNFAPHYRSTQIAQRLASRDDWTPPEMIGLQKDVYSGFSAFLARNVVAACDRRKVSNPSLADAIALLRAWNGQMERDRPEPLLATYAFQHLRKAVAQSAAPGKAAAYESQMAPAVLERLLSERPPGWFADWDETLVRAFADAVEEGARSQGPSVKKWIYGKYNELTVAHPLSAAFRVRTNWGLDFEIPYARKLFDIGPVEMSGSATTVKQTTRRLGPSMRMVATPGDWDASLLNLPAGQSGHVLSKHYKDQWDAFFVGTSYPMQFNRVKAVDVLELEPEPPGR